MLRTKNGIQSEIHIIACPSTSNNLWNASNAFRKFDLSPQNRKISILILNYSSVPHRNCSYSLGAIVTCCSQLKAPTRDRGTRSWTSTKNEYLAAFLAFPPVVEPNSQFSTATKSKIRDTCNPLSSKTSRAGDESIIDSVCSQVLPSLSQYPP